jgi:Zn-dependent peptidase ImmA (M78 family)
VDVGVGIDIIPVDGIYAAFGVDAWLSADGSRIHVDQSVASHHCLHRYRFTLAHELAHRILHQLLLRAAQYGSIDEYYEFQTSIPEEDYMWYEYQANSFAGLVLVPPEPLRRYLQQGVALAWDEQGIRIDTTVDAHREYLAEWVGRRFEVSGEVILRRCRFDSHW